MEATHPAFIKQMEDEGLIEKSGTPAGEKEQVNIPKETTSPAAPDSGSNLAAAAPVVEAPATGEAPQPENPKPPEVQKERYRPAPKRAWFRPDPLPVYQRPIVTAKPVVGAKQLVASDRKGPDAVKVPSPPPVAVKPEVVPVTPLAAPMTLGTAGAEKPGVATPAASPAMSKPSTVVPPVPPIEKSVSASQPAPQPTAVCPGMPALPTTENLARMPTIVATKIERQGPGSPSPRCQAPTASHAGQSCPGVEKINTISTCPEVRAEIGGKARHPGSSPAHTNRRPTDCH